MEVQEASSSAPLPVIHDSKTPQKKNSAPVSSKSSKRKYNKLTDATFITSNVIPLIRNYLQNLIYIEMIP